MNIYEAINKTMEDIGVVGKNEKNPDQGWKYRGIDAVMNALNPAMVKNGIFVIPEVLDMKREERTNKKGNLLIHSVCTVQYTFFAEDGTSVKAVVIGEAMDSGDKSINKAMSAAFKYACFQTFCIPTEEMKDPDAEVHEVEPKKVSEIIDEEYGKKPEDWLDRINAELERTGVKAKDILKVFELKKIEDMTDAQYTVCMNKFAVTGNAGANP